MEAKPTRQHDWLMQLLGEWTFETECSAGQDQPPMKMTGTEIARSLGGLWLVSEWTGPTPSGEVATSIITLGFDPQKDRFVGTFIAPMMSHLWIYNGSLDEAGKVLTLDAEGPKFRGEGIAKYQDIIELVSPDHKILRSRVLGEDGLWAQFMTSEFRRTK